MKHLKTFESFNFGDGSGHVRMDNTHEVEQVIRCLRDLQDSIDKAIKSKKMEDLIGVGNKMYHFYDGRNGVIKTWTYFTKTPLAEKILHNLKSTFEIDGDGVKLKSTSLPGISIPKPYTELIEEIEKTIYNLVETAKEYNTIYKRLGRR
jgi:hypothetical protein